MSSGAVRLADARAIAAAAVEAFRGLGAGVDAEPVGSVRRCRPIVGDVEVLVTGSTPMQIRFALHAIGAERGPPNKRGARAPWGPRYYRAVLPNGDHTIGLDVFVCLPAECLSCGKFINNSRAAQRNGPVPRVSANLSGQVICPYCGSRRIRPGAEYGVLRLIRTGSRDFSQAVVTRLHRYGLESRDGRVVDRNDGGPFPTPTEEGVLRLAHLPWIPPSEREMDNPATLAAFRREAAPWECPDQSPAPVRVGVLPARTGDGTPACACRICGMVHPPGACP